MTGPSIAEPCGAGDGSGLAMIAVETASGAGAAGAVGCVRHVKDETPTSAIEQAERCVGKAERRRGARGRRRQARIRRFPCRVTLSPNLTRPAWHRGHGTRRGRFCAKVRPVKGSSRAKKRAQAKRRVVPRDG